MSGIKGKAREQKDFNNLEVGLFVGKVKAINPSIQEYKEILGIELKEDSKAAEYLGESKDGNTSLRLDVWTEDIKRAGKFKKIVFFLEDKEKTNKDETKKQYINASGACSWASDEDGLLSWFVKRPFRVAKVGEEQLYNFLKVWLGKLDLKDDDAELSINWKNLMKGKVDELKEQIGGEFETTFVPLATVKSVEKEGETKEYQQVYNGAFLPEYSLKNFRVVDYSDETVLSGLKKKQNKDLKPHERFVLQVTGEYGPKEFFVLKEIKEYNPAENIAASDKVITETGADY